MFYCVVPVHNRRTTTLACLDRLQKNGDLDHVGVIVVDANSSDGTSEAIRQNFPSVEIVQADEKTWWGGAIWLGTERAMTIQGCEGVIWLNDDCRVKRGTLLRLVAEAGQCGGISVGESIDPNGVVYGGWKKRWQGTVLARPTEGRLMVDSFSGNCVCIPAGVLHEVGPIDWVSFPHHFADVDYGLRASRMGIPILVCPGEPSENDANDGVGQSSWLRDSRGSLEIVKSFRSVRSMMHWPSRRAFYHRHWGGWGLVLAVVPYARFAAIVCLRGILALVGRCRANQGRGKRC